MSYFSLNGNLNLMQSIWHQCRCLACLMPSFSTYNQSFPCCADFGQYQMMYLTVLCGSWLPLFVRKEEWTLQIPAKIVHSLAWETLSNWLKVVVKIDESTLMLVSQPFFSGRGGHRAHQSATLGLQDNDLRADGTSHVTFLVWWTAQSDNMVLTLSTKHCFHIVILIMLRSLLPP
jgi:hypothetical protein